MGELGIKIPSRIVQSNKTSSFAYVFTNVLLKIEQQSHSNIINYTFHVIKLQNVYVLLK